MKILEVRDGFIKFEADENIFLSSFVKVESSDKSYICQVIQLRTQGLTKNAYAKILFLYNNGFMDYDKSLPPKDAIVREFPYEEIAKLVKIEKPVIVGKMTDSFADISLDLSAFNKKLLITADEKEDDQIIVSNLIHQFNNVGKNTIVLDTLGRLDMMKYTAGVDFKLPLDTASLKFIYEECLNDATDESKALIEEIFNDLSAYSETVPFLPFETLKAIVDDMVDNSHILKLLVLKNKLSKFSRMGYFASNKEEVDKLKLILKSRSAVLDLSKLDSAFQNKYLKWIYESLKGTTKTQVIVELSNVVSKQNLKKLLTEEDSSPITFITHSKFKYLNDIKVLFDNFIIVPSVNNNAIFKVYATFLKSMEKGTYLIVGAGTNYIPLVSKLFDFSTKAESEEEDNADLEQLITDSDVKEENNVEEENSEKTLDETDLEQDAEQNAQDEKIEENTYNTVVHPDVVDMFGSEDDENEEKEYSEADIEDIQTEEVSPTTDDNEKIELDEISQVTDVENNTDYEVIPQEISAEDSVIEVPLEADTFEEIQEISAENSEEVNIGEYQEISVTDEFSGNNNAEFTDDEPENLSSFSEFEETPEEIIPVELDEDINLDLTEDIGNESTEENTQEQESQEQEQTEISEPEVLPIGEDSENYNFEEIQELDLSEAGEDDIIVDMSDNMPDEINEDLNDEISRDVDKVYMTRKDDDISDSDLDFIDELNSDNSEGLLEEIPDDDSVLEELSKDDEIEEINEIPLEKQADEEPSEILETRDSSTPIVPVYDADIPQEDLVMSDPIQQGDSVVHAKYGSGVVEKMIKYGNKTLYSINFDNVGRRLLDPTLTEIKKS